MPTLVTPTVAPSSHAVPGPLPETRGYSPVSHVSCVPGGWYPAAKSFFDWILSAVLLVLLSPFIAVSALLVKLTSRGPAFYSQVRLGKNGLPFRIYKLRTMTHNCEHKTGAQWAIANDPRITRIGRVMRATHLDELPQLWNVLKGDMSLVGPRPERPEFVPQLEQAISHYRDRLDVRPGVTGLAQVQLPADTDIDSVRRKLAYDLYYIRHMGLWLDLKLIASTALHVFLVPYGLLAILFRLPGQDRVERAYQERVTAHQTPLMLAPAGAL